MGNFKKIIIIFIVITFIYQQNFEKYLDIFNIKEFINKKNDSKNDFIEINLLYSRAEGIYLVFYDKTRKEIWVQFKEDKYDDIHHKIQYDFISGQPYKIKMKWIGIIKDQSFIDKKDFSFKEEDISYLTFVFSLIDYYPLIQDEIFF